MKFNDSHRSFPRCGRSASLGAAALLFTIVFSGCPLVVIGLLSGPIAVGSAVTGAAIGSQTAYYNLQDFYDAVTEKAGEEFAGAEAVEGLRFIDLYRRSYQTLDGTVTPHALSPEEYVTLAQLKRRDGQRFVELQKNIGIRNFPLTSTIETLQEKRLVGSRVFEGAGRFEIYQTTDEAETRLREVIPALEHMRFDYLRRLSLEERQDLTRLLAKAVGEPDSPAAGSTGGILGLSTGGEAEFLLAKHLVDARWTGEALLNRYGLSLPEFQVITSLWLVPEVGLKGLSSLTQLRRNELLAVANSLEKQGYVKKIDRVSEEGAWILRPGPKAEELKNRLKPEVENFDNQVFSKLAPDERERMKELISEMTRGVVG